MIPRWALVGLLTPLAMPAQERLHLTLPEAEAAAVKNYPRLAASRQLELAAGELPKEIRAAYQPSFSGALTAAGADSGSRLAAGGLNNPALYSRTGAGLMMTQLLSDFGRTAHRLEAARQSAQASGELTAAVRASLILDVRRSYLAALRAAALVHVAGRTVAARELVSDQVATLARNGLKSELDAKFAAVNVSDAKLLLADSTNQLKAAETALSALTGLDAPRGFDLADPPARPSLEGDVESYVRTALAQRPDLAALRFEQRSAEEKVKAEHALWRPEISLIGAAGFAPVAEAAVPGRYGAAAVNVTIPVFNGGLFGARQRESEYRASAAAGLLREQEVTVSRDVRITWLNLQTARDRLALTTQLVGQARLAQDLARGRYELGLGSIVEFSQSQLNLTSAELAQTSARYELEIQRAELDYRAGLRQ